MLILSRKIGSTIQIGEDICIKVTEINGDTVKLAIDAPKEISIVRGELVEVKKANQEAAKHSNFSYDSISNLWNQPKL